MRCTKSTFSLLLVSFCILTAPSVKAQEPTVRACISVASDPDGDGFGWEWDRVETRYDSCLVTSESQTAPAAIDESGNFTGESQIRAYWNANRDIAGRTIVCENLDRSSTTQLLEVVSVFEFQHDPLPLVSPFMAFAEFSGTSDWSNLSENLVRRRPTEVWTVQDGIYRGPMLLSPWVQIIDRDGRPDNAIRYRAGFATFECYDPTGAAFVPTGSFDEVLPQPQPQQAQPPTILSAAPDDEEIPETEVIINLETGNEVFLQTPVWDLYKDFVGREITCSDLTWSESIQRYVSINGLRTQKSFKYYPVYSSSLGNEGLLVTERVWDNSYLNNFDFTIIDGAIRPDEIPVFSFGKVEIVNDSSVRLWSSSTFYYACRDSGRVAGIELVDASDARALVPSGEFAIADADNQTVTMTADTNDVSVDQPDTVAMLTNDSDTPSSGGGAFSVWMLVLMLRARRWRKPEQLKDL